MTRASVTPRQRVLAVALAASVAATLWVAQMDDDEAPTVTTRPARTTRAPAAAVLPAAPLPRWEPVARAPWPDAPPARLAAWGPPAPPPAPPIQPQQPVAPPPAPAPPPEAAPAPVAPAFPYQLIGRLEEGGVSQALLSAGNRSLNAKAGDVIDGQWRVESVGATGLSLLWLPARQPHTITFRPAS